MPKRTRRSLKDVLAATRKFASNGPFTPKELGDSLKVTPNRARQLLEALKKQGKLTELGKRKSSRGKPATLWGAKGTTLSAADVAARPSTNGSKKPVAGKRPVGRPPGSRNAVAASASAIASFPALDALLERISTEGLEVSGPGGITFRVRIGGEAKAAPKARKAAPKKRRAKKKKAAAQSVASASAEAASAKAPTKPARKKKPAKRKSAKRKAAGKKVAAKTVAPKAATKAAPKRKPAKRKPAKRKAKRSAKKATAASPKA